MNSREKILAAVKNNQPAAKDAATADAGKDAAVPDRPGMPDGRATTNLAGAPDPADPDHAEKFMTMLTSIGGTPFIIHDIGSIARIVREQYPDAKRIVSVYPGLTGYGGDGVMGEDPHSLADVDLAIIPAHFGVAENGACWVTEELLTERALPFISQHLALVIHKKDIVATMHQAYDRIAVLEAQGTGGGAAGGNAEGSAASGNAGGGVGSASAEGYGFGVFIAGPSKTADIEQSLVLGAHGPRSMIVFLLDQDVSDIGYY